MTKYNWINMIKFIDFDLRSGLLLPLGFILDFLHVHVRLQPLLIHLILDSKHLDDLLFRFNLLLVVCDLTDDILSLQEVEGTPHAVRRLRSISILSIFSVAHTSYLSYMHMIRWLSRRGWNDGRGFGVWLVSVRV